MERSVLKGATPVGVAVLASLAAFVFLSLFLDGFWLYFLSAITLVVTFLYASGTRLVKTREKAESSFAFLSSVQGFCARLICCALLALPLSFMVFMHTSAVELDIVSLSETNKVSVEGSAYRFDISRGNCTVVSHPRKDVTVKVGEIGTLLRVLQTGDQFNLSWQSSIKPRANTKLSDVTIDMIIISNSQFVEAERKFRPTHVLLKGEDVLFTDCVHKIPEQAGFAFSLKRLVFESPVVFYSNSNTYRVMEAGSVEKQALARDYDLARLLTIFGVLVLVLIGADSALRAIIHFVGIGGTVRAVINSPVVLAASLPVATLVFLGVAYWAVFPGITPHDWPYSQGISGDFKQWLSAYHSVIYYISYSLTGQLYYVVVAQIALFALLLFSVGRAISKLVLSNQIILLFGLAVFLLLIDPFVIMHIFYLKRDILGSIALVFAIVLLVLQQKVSKNWVAYFLALAIFALATKTDYVLPLAAVLGGFCLYEKSARLRYAGFLAGLLVCVPVLGVISGLIATGEVAETRMVFADWLYFLYKNDALTADARQLIDASTTRVSLSAFSKGEELSNLQVIKMGLSHLFTNPLQIFDYLAWKGHALISDFPHYRPPGDVTLLINDFHSYGFALVQDIKNWNIHPFFRQLSFVAFALSCFFLILIRAHKTLLASLVVAGYLLFVLFASPGVRAFYFFFWPLWVYLSFVLGWIEVAKASLSTQPQDDKAPAAER